MNTLTNFWNNRKRYWAYFLTVLRHKFFIIMALRKLPPVMFKQKEYYPILIKLVTRLITHDLSKLRFSEFFPYSKCFYKSDGSPRYEETFESDVAWNHHLNRNRHHWQYWLRTDDSGKTVEIPIPLIDVLEMILDWIAAGSYRNAEPWLVWYNKSKDNMKINRQTKFLIDNFYFKPENMLEYDRKLKRHSDEL